MNIRLTYEYRDHASYHETGEIVFANPGRLRTRHIEARLRAAMQGQERFIARQVSLPEVFFKKEAFPFGGEDHSWHTLICASTTPDLQTDKARRTIAQFIVEVQQADKLGWDWKRVPEELLEVLHKIEIPQALSLIEELARKE